MPDKKIEILGINDSTRKLKLSDGGRTIVYTSWNKRHVEWKIIDNRIKSFKIVGKTSYNPFEESIPETFDTKVKLEVKSRQLPVEWEYSIHWTDGSSNPPHISDPKISVNPKRKDSLILWLTTFFLSLFGIFLFWRKKRNIK